MSSGELSAVSASPRGSRPARRAQRAPTGGHTDMDRLGRGARHVLGAVLLLATVSAPATAQRGSLNATLTAHRVSPTSDTLTLHIAVRMTTGWHIGAARPGMIGVPTELTWRLPVG